MKRSRTIDLWLLTILVLILVVVVSGRQLRQRLAEWQYERSTPSKEVIADIVDPPTKPLEEIKENVEGSLSSAVKTDTHTAVPTALNRTVPFTSQAPTGKWDQHHEEYCEEASALMVGRYLHDRDITGPDDAEAGLLELEQWEIEHFGFFESTTAEQTAAMIHDVYGLDATVSQAVNADSIKQALADSSLIILPTAGRELHNPYFKQPGPVYHMLVVKGFAADGRFITHDPGTRRGADFVYKASTLIQAVGDYNNNDPAHGQKIMIVVSKSQST